MFKEDFKYYKLKQPPPDLSQVLDFRSPDTIRDKVQQVTCTEIDTNVLYGLEPVQHWEIYELINHPGLMFIKNPFTSLGQRYWIIRCLRDYTKRPNKLNLDIHGIIPENKTWWQMSQEHKNKHISEKLRWATLGYHHNWDSKVYNEDSKSDFPPDLALLSKYVANVLGYKNFNAEAAIVNYYYMNSTLSGHTDHSEQFLEAPLFSFSFGQSAIFLLGGTSLDTKPTAMFLNSGDIIIMSKESRLCYHGVPKIICATNRSWNQNDIKKDEITNFKGLVYETIKDCKDVQFWKPFDKYLNNSRININVRQVLKRGQKALIISN